jgi:hypothetical protein
MVKKTFNEITVTKGRGFGEGDSLGAGSYSGTGSSCGFECSECSGTQSGDWGFGFGNASEDTITYDLGFRGFGEGAFLGAGSHDCTGNG